ncbi:MAG: DHHA1 domain-containing protein [Bacteroidia bacterium]|nr:DHHA1 domain-containing protein [Bacteroidia bacterium]MDW8089006.1 DHHA1 domain-containing protein [Bacteroidia bacterium]
MRLFQGLLAIWELHPKALSFAPRDPIPAPIQAALANRGITSQAELEAFLHPDWNLLADPYQLPDLPKGLFYFHRAIQQKDFIYAVADYDVDGTAAAALLGRFLKGIGHPTNRFWLHIPNRHREGYGISQSALQDAYRRGTGLFIALDCGTKENEKIRQLQEKGIPTLVLDHHAVELVQVGPKADAFINPQRPDSAYPNRYLSATAVTYQFLRAYQASYGAEFPLEQEIDLVALSLLADIMPIQGENRTLIQLGLRYFPQALRPGLHALMEKAGVPLDRPPRSREVVFQIIPRLNSAGRLKSARYALYLLYHSNWVQDIPKVAHYLDELNRKRQRLQEAALQAALDQLGLPTLEALPPALVAASPLWEKGVIGLVAAKLVERFYRPAVVFTQNSDGSWTGSARSPQGIPLPEVFAQVRRMASFSYFKVGGHERAAGLTIGPQDLEAFRMAFSQACANYPTPIRREVIDAVVEPDQLANAEIVEWCERFEPIGQGSEAPRFLVQGLTPDFLSGQLCLRRATSLFFPLQWDRLEREQLEPFLKQQVGKPISAIVTPRRGSGRRIELRLRDILPNLLP